MESKKVYNLQSIFSSQLSSVAAISVHDIDGGRFMVLRNGSHSKDKISEFAPALIKASNLNNICLVGALSVLERAGVTVEMLKEKGAIVDLETLITMAKEAAQSSSGDEPDVSVLKVYKEAILTILQHWKSRELSRTDEFLNAMMDKRATQILVEEWYKRSGSSNNELIDVLHKRVSRHVHDVACAYLGQLVDRNADQEKAQPNDKHLLIVGKINYLHTLSDDERSAYRDLVLEQVLVDYFANSKSKADIHKQVRENRDHVVLTMYRDGSISEELSRKLDADLTEEIASRIRLYPVDFAKDCKELSAWVCNAASEKHKGRAVDRLDPYNKQVIKELIDSWKKRRINSDLRKDLEDCMMPLIHSLVLKSQDEEKAVVAQSIDSIVMNPQQLADAARVQFISTVQDVVRNFINIKVTAADDKAGNELMVKFSSELLSHLKSNSVNFKDLKKINALFNTEEESVVSLINSVIKPGFYAAIHPGTGLFSSTAKAEAEGTTARAPVKETPVVAPSNLSGPNK